MKREITREELEKSIQNINEPLNLDIQKGKVGMVGEIRTWSGKKYKKQANGKWLEVSEGGATKKEHELEVNKYRSFSSGRAAGRAAEDKKLGYMKEKTRHEVLADKLSDKELDDSDFEEKEEKFEDILEKAKSPAQFWNKMSSETKKEFLKETGLMDSVAHLYTTAGSREGKPNVGVAILNVSTGNGAGEGVIWGDLERYLKQDITRYFESKKGEVEKSPQDHFSNINKPLNLTKEETIQKSDVYYALNDNSSSNQSISKFKKKGSELKELAIAKKAKYEAKKAPLETKRAELVSKIKEDSTIECIEGEYGCKFDYNYETTPQNIRTLISQYNNLSYECDGITKDIKAANVIIKHCEDNKVYEVTARQLIALEDD